MLGHYGDYGDTSAMLIQYWACVGYAEAMLGLEGFPVLGYVGYKMGPGCSVSPLGEIVAMLLSDKICK